MSDRLFAFKLSDGFYYRTGYATGQRLYLADIIPEHNIERITKISLHLSLNVDPNFKLVEVVIEEKKC